MTWDRTLVQHLSHRTGLLGHGRMATSSRRTKGRMRHRGQWGRRRRRRCSRR
ncbi:hypothetical protein SORBI_3008G142450 [Sorghum bicolor]|uniref:Uncharacterized protein n=1 Tax=Sorghum bicolor TaxID=4558 RepID=A0A1Z5R6R3_SORBI|nr:hypothetical protein SORBI_3008G142450 [Sorghum bicolor]